MAKFDDFARAKILSKVAQAIYDKSNPEIHFGDREDAVVDYLLEKFEREDADNSDEKSLTQFLTYPTSETLSSMVAADTDPSSVLYEVIRVEFENANLSVIGDAMREVFRPIAAPATTKIVTGTLSAYFLNSADFELEVPIDADADKVKKIIDAMTWQQLVDHRGRKAWSESVDEDFRACLSLEVGDVTIESFPE